MTERLCRLLKTAVIGLAFAAVFVFSIKMDIHAAETTYTLGIEAFESSEQSNHSAYETEKKSRFSYGENSMGTLTVSGVFNDISAINGFTAYSASGPLIIGYDYDGSHQTGNKNEWNLISEDGREVLGFSISKRIEKGTLIIQKSIDGIDWENAAEQVQNIFTAKNLDRSNLYTITDDELKSGTYYRVIVVYGMRRLSATEERWWIIPDKETYDYIYCTEVYKFYACYGISTVSFRDVVSGNEISSGATVSNGFIIDKNSASSSVYLVKDGKATTIVDGIRTSVYEPGEYNITVSTPLNQEYKYNFTVKGGLSVRHLSPSVFENEKRKKYTEEHPVSGNPAYGFKSHTGLTLAHNAADEIVAATKNGIDAYGITGSNVYLFFELKNEEALADTGWEVVSDSWGKKSSELIAGLSTGQVDSGAIIIQKSTDGLTWENENLGRYAKGLYTTDFENHYGRKGTVLVYMPDGQEILNGVFVRILYAYEMKQSSTKTDNRYIEKYEFYLCNNELGAVAFHNLSAEGTLSDICKDYDDATAEVYRKAETMQTGAYTVSGFSIDTTLNPTVTYKVKRDGTNIAIPSNHEFTQEGKYTVDLTSAVGTHKEVEIFVDRMSSNDALDFYFGEAFITGKRIFDEGELAVYEGGLTSYQINEIDLNHLPLGGVIKNITTGEIVTISHSRTRKSSLLTTPGTYEAILSTNSGVSSGDNRVFTFRFKIIPKGTAPGPVVNQRSLKEYASSTISDSYPVYYALTYPSASTGYITLAFASKEAAMEYAYNYEKGMVEKQSDGSYRYTGSFLVSQKEKYDSAWDLTDAVNYFAEQAVQSGYFDISNDFTALTLTDSVIDNTDNLRTLELNKSVTIFAPDQKEELTDLEALPIISPKPFSYLTPGRNGVVSRGVNDFKFVRDKYGSDSDTIQITDNTGKEYQIEYNRGVGEQLSAQDCPSGIVTIVEKTIYGDTASYQAVYIAPAENTASITLSYYKDEREERQIYTQKNNGTQVEAEAFSVVALKDNLDPYGLVVISDGQKEYYYAADEITKGVWAVPGDYTVKVVNRLGHYYSIAVRVVESDYAAISFSGYGTENTQDILTTFGALNVKLPVLTRYGYNLVGFEDGTGTLYKDEISTIAFKGEVVLNAIWQAKQYTITLQGPEGNVLNTLVVDYGKEYELPIPDLPQGYSFTGWAMNGNLLANNLITLESEGDVTLVARTIGIKESSASEENKPGDAASEKSVLKGSPTGLIRTILLVIVIAAGATGAFFYKKNKKENSAVNTESETDRDEETEKYDEEK